MMISVDYHPSFQQIAFLIEEQGNNLKDDPANGERGQSRQHHSRAILLQVQQSLALNANSPIAIGSHIPCDFQGADFEFVRSEFDTPIFRRKNFQPPARKPSLRPVVLAYPTPYLVDEPWSLRRLTSSFTGSLN